MNRRPIIGALVLIFIILLFPPRATDEIYSNSETGYAARGFIFDPYFRIAEIEGRLINIGKVRNGTFGPAHLDTGRMLAEIGLVLCMFSFIFILEPKNK